MIAKLITHRAKQLILNKTLNYSANSLMKTCNNTTGSYQMFIEKYYILSVIYLEAKTSRIRWGGEIQLPLTGYRLHLDVFTQVSDGWQSTYIRQKNCVKINVKSDKVTRLCNPTLNSSVHCFLISHLILTERQILQPWITINSRYSP